MSQQSALAPPQLVIISRMLYSSWVPPEPEKVAALLPRGLEPAPNRAVYTNQYVVDSAEQTSGFGCRSSAPARGWGTKIGLVARGLPAEPLQVVAGSSWFAPRDSFVYPGGE